MKKLLTTLLLFLIPSLLFAVSAGDLRIAQRNSTNTAWVDVIFSTGVSSYIGTNSSGVPVIRAGGGGGGDGTVTSIAASGGTTGFSFTGSPITTNGTLTLTLSDAPAARTALGLTIGTNVQAYAANLTSWAAIATATKASVTQIGFRVAGVVFDGGGSAVPTSTVSVTRIDRATSITSATLYLKPSESGTVTVSVQKNGTTISGSAPIVLSSGTSVTVTDFSAWSTTTFAVGDIFSVTTTGTPSAIWFAVAAYGSVTIN